MTEEKEGSGRMIGCYLNGSRSLRGRASIFHCYESISTCASEFLLFFFLIRHWWETEGLLCLLVSYPWYIILVFPIPLWQPTALLLLDSHSGSVRTSGWGAGAVFVFRNTNNRRWPGICVTNNWDGLIARATQKRNQCMTLEWQSHIWGRPWQMTVLLHRGGQDNEILEG